MSAERATPDEHTREIERIHKLIDVIRKQAEALQRAAHKLPEGQADGISEKADELRYTADRLIEKVEELEHQT